MMGYAGQARGGARAGRTSGVYRRLPAHGLPLRSLFFFPDDERGVRAVSSCRVRKDRKVLITPESQIILSAARATAG